MKKLVDRSINIGSQIKNINNKPIAEKGTYYQLYTGAFELE